jgi:hypothetical protein
MHTLFWVHPFGGFTTPMQARKLSNLARTLCLLRKADMNFDEKMEGDYRIYAGAVESPQGDGYIAAVVINRVRGDKHSLREAYRDESLACGHRWASPDAALQYAVTKARELIHTETARLAC